MKFVRIIFSPEAEKVYRYLNSQAENSKTDRMILKAINQKVEFIKANIHYGNPISKDKIPDEYKQKYAAINLFRVELPNFWRMLYTLTNNNEVEIVAFILDIVNHPDYDKKFGYQKK